jgi:hypothetical protein
VVAGHDIQIQLVGPFQETASLVSSRGDSAAVSTSISRCPRRSSISPLPPWPNAPGPITVPSSRVIGKHVGSAGEGVQARSSALWWPGPPAHCDSTSWPLSRRPPSPEFQNPSSPWV